MKKPARNLLMAVGLFSSDLASASARVPDRTTLLKIESVIKLPAEADALTTYVRFYAFDQLTVSKGRKISVIRGTFLAEGYAPFGRAGAFAVRKLPDGPADGGCIAVHVLYDLTKRKVISAYCNDFA